MSKIKFSRDKSLVGTALLYNNNFNPKLRVLVEDVKRKKLPKISKNMALYFARI
jgi:hypothetical protein